MSDEYYVFPRELRREIDAALSDILRAAVDTLLADRAYVGFVDEDGIVRVPARLMIPPGDPHIATLHWKRGLTGASMRMGKIVRYPDDTEYREDYWSTSKDVSAEIAGPLRHHGCVLGTIWLDRLTPKDSFEAPSVPMLQEFIGQLERQVHGIIEEAEDVGARLLDLAQSCYVETRSSRGYIAIKRVAGGLDYFKVGIDKDKFLPLSQFEGLCGVVLQTGKPINSPNVRKDPRYIPSHAKVESEIIYPIFEGDETVAPIGIINMESFGRDAYNKRFHVDTIARLAAQAASLARLYRRSLGAGAGSILQELAEFLIKGLYAGGTEEPTLAALDDSIAQALGRACQIAVDGELYHWWTAEDWDKRGWYKTVSDPTTEGGVIALGDNRCGVYRHLASSGVRFGTVGVECKDGTSISNRQQFTVEQLCVAATAFFAHWHHEYRYRQYVDLIELLTGKDDAEVIVTECVLAVPSLLDSRHCTVFLRAVYDQETVLVPGPSSAGQLVAKPGLNPFYVWREEAGLTAYVASHQCPLVLANLQDSDELQSVSPRLTWARNLAEDPNAHPHAFMAYPIKCAGEGDQVIGVLRTYRDQTESAFTKAEAVMFGAIARLLSHAVTCIVTRRGWEPV